MNIHLTLKDAVDYWPPLEAAPGRDPSPVDREDVVVRARLSRDHHLVLGMQSGKDNYTAAAPVSRRNWELVDALLQKIPGLSLADAESMTLHRIEAMA
jgi:hypothetical protein